MTGLVILWAVGFAAATGWVARLRDRSIPIWVLFGAILGPVAVILLWVAPPGRCATCRAPVRGWMTICQWCGMDVSGAQRAPTGRSTWSDLRGLAGSQRAKRADHARPLLTVTPTRRPTDPVIVDEPIGLEAAPAETSDVVAPPVAAAVASTSAADPVATTPPTKPRRRGSRASTPAKTAGRPAKVVTTGVFLTGTVGLAPGSRYTIQVDGDALQVVGPSDRTPRSVAFERALEGIDATGLEGRLILSGAGTRGGTVLVFQSIEGGDTATIARTIMQLAQTPATSAS